MPWQNFFFLLLPANARKILSWHWGTFWSVSQKHSYNSLHPQTIPTLLPCNVINLLFCNNLPEMPMFLNWFLNSFSLLGYRCSILLPFWHHILTLLLVFRFVCNLRRKKKLENSRNTIFFTINYCNNYCAMYHLVFITARSSLALVVFNNHVGGGKFDSNWSTTQGLKITEEKVLPL